MRGDGVCVCVCMCARGEGTVCEGVCEGRVCVRQGRRSNRFAQAEGRLQYIVHQQHTMRRILQPLLLHTQCSVHYNNTTHTTPMTDNTTMATSSVYSALLKKAVPPSSHQSP